MLCTLGFYTRPRCGSMVFSVFVRDGIGSQLMKSLRIRFKLPSAPSAIVPVLLALVLATIQSASAQTNDAPTCATGSAVPDAAGNPGLVSDCEALLASREHAERVDSRLVGKAGEVGEPVAE